MWNILYVRPVIGKCICPTSWSTYELTTAAVATATTNTTTFILLLLLLLLLLIKKATTEVLEQKCLVSEVCSVQNSR